MIQEMIESGIPVTIAVKADELRELFTEWAKKLNENKGETAKDNLITREEAAQRLGVTFSTLWRWNKGGYLKSVKIGKKVMYRESDLRRIAEDA